MSIYTQELICPKCGRPAVVNVLKRGGETRSPCQNCKACIIVVVGKDGHIKNVTFEPGGCFIATACIRASESEKSGSELIDLFRSYRDDYVQHREGGINLLDEYYSSAPSILKSISDRKDSDEILLRLYHVLVLPSASLISKGQYEEALELYRGIYAHLKDKYT